MPRLNYYHLFFPVHLDKSYHNIRFLGLFPDKRFIFPDQRYVKDIKFRDFSSFFKNKCSFNGRIYMLSAYPACFIKEETGYSVIFPDLNHLATCGDTLDESLAMAVDCLAGYLYRLQKDGETAPKASSIEQINPVEIAEELEVSPDKAFINIITVDVAEYAKTHFEKSVKKTLSIPAWLNKAALEQNINFSQVLQDALKAQLYLN